jgi:hypothetical protein
MSNKKVTTAEWLGKELESYGDPQFCKIKWEELDSLIHQAKEMEKQQIIDAWENGQDNIDSDGCHIDMNGAQQYYNETYGGQNND